MEKSKVYFTDMRTGFDDGLLNKLKTPHQKSGHSGYRF